MLLNRNDLIETRNIYKNSFAKEKKKILICAGYWLYCRWFLRDL